MPMQTSFASVRLRARSLWAHVNFSSIIHPAAYSGKLTSNHLLHLQRSLREVLLSDFFGEYAIF